MFCVDVFEYRERYGVAVLVDPLGKRIVAVTGYELQHPFLVGAEHGGIG